jgi:hypothetical protein
MLCCGKLLNGLHAQVIAINLELLLKCEINLFLIYTNCKSVILRYNIHTFCVNCTNVVLGRNF